MKKLLLGIALTAALGASAAPKVLVYMLDGARADALEAVNHPVWQALKANRWADGYKTAWSITAGNEPFVLPASAPNHAVIATGKLAKHHKVMNNKDKFYANFSHAATPTWQERIGRKFPDTRIVQVFSWAPDVMFMPESGIVSVVSGADGTNNQVLVKMLGRKNAPSVLMVFDDAPDHAGHKHGYYPYTKPYLTKVRAAMQRFSNLLDAIKTQPTFAEDDWLIVLCSDHGGVGKVHYTASPQSYTVPLLYCGKHIPAGEISGRPNNLGIAANVLRHMGLGDEVAELDDDGRFAVAAPEKRPVAEGLLCDLAVRNGKVVDRAKKGGVTPRGSLAVGKNAFRTGKNGYLTLDGLKNFSGDALTFAITFECDLSAIKSDPMIFGNKDWQTGANPGIALVAQKGGLFFNSGRDRGQIDHLMRSPHRVDLWDIAIGKGKNLVAVSIRRDGLVTVFQKGADGREYWFRVKCDRMRVGTKYDWNIGQDGTGRYGHHADFEVSGFRFWNRALALDELRKLKLE